MTGGDRVDSSASGNAGLVEVTRGELVECVHRGDIAVVDSHGQLLYAVGDPDKVSYMRSSAKPIQAINVVLSGAYEHFQLTAQELAVICSSHYAEPFHLEAVRSILGKIGLDEHAILGGTVTSLNAQYALKLAWDHVELNPLFSDCSGKHAGMLSVCQRKGYSLSDYLSPDHPCQKEIIAIIATLCDIDIQKIIIGIDGCSAPVHALPLYNIAKGFARFANPSRLPENFQRATETIFQAMVNNPEMISGTDGFCSDLLRHTHGKLIGKVGAEGVYCVGIKDRDLGFAVKIESGSMAVLPPVVIRVLTELNILDEDERQALDNYAVMDNRNDVGLVVGKMSPLFSIFH